MLKLTLRAPEPHDVNLIYIWENSGDERHSSLRTGPLSRHAITRFVEDYDGELYTQGALRFMIDLDGETVGTIDIFDYDARCRHAFVGIYVSPKYRRRGVALEAIANVEKQMVITCDLHSLAAVVSAENKPSHALFSKAGYRKCGVLEGWLNDGRKRIDAFLFQHVL